MKRILIISFSDIRNDPRVYRQVKHLKSSYEIVTVGFKESGVEGVEFIPIRERGTSKPKKAMRMLRLKLNDFKGYYEATFDVEPIRDMLKERSFDLILANDSDSLPLVFSWDHDIPVLHDAHEYAPRQIDDQWWWRFFMREYMKWICRTYLKRCRAITTVTHGIASEYLSNYGVYPRVITSATDYVDIQPSPVENGRVRMVHHGSANPSRGIENYIELMDILDDRFSLDLYLVYRDSLYISKIKKMAETRNNVRILDAVPMQELVTTCNKYDVGVFMQKPVNFNLEYSLPNKFFEFVQSRLLVAITPLPEIQKYVREMDLGVVSQSYDIESMALELKKLDNEKIRYHKLQSHLHAKELSSEPNMMILDEIVKQTID